MSDGGKVLIGPVLVATDDVRTLIAELDRTLSAEYPPEQQHGLALDAIFQPHIRFFLAWLNGKAVGCGGVALFTDFAEVKRMYVRDAARGRGVAQALLARLEQEARAAGLTTLRLETGERQVAAMRLYARAGFRRCPAFGAYAAMAPAAISTSVFLEKRLDMEPRWLVWAREMQALAQTGLAFSRDPYDRERYARLRTLAAEIVADYGRLDVAHAEALFVAENGYATPKLDVRGAVFRDGRILLVRETTDGGRWTLPGGWADVNESPSACIVKEVREESGYAVRVGKLAAVWDRARHAHVPHHPFHIWKLFFICEIVGGEARTGLETSEVGFFAKHDLPADLSAGRVLDWQLRRMFAHMRQPELPTEFD